MNTFTLFDTNDVAVLSGVSLNDCDEVSVQMFTILQERKEEILSATNQFTVEDLWYSEYYWCLAAMKQLNVENRADWQDVLDHIIEYMDCEIEIDCEILEKLHNENGRKTK